MLLTIKDKEYGLVWGQLAFEALEESRSTNESGLMLIAMIQDELNAGKDKLIRELTFEAIKLWCRRNQVSLDIDYFDFVEWLDNLDDNNPFTPAIIKSYQESVYRGKNINEWIEHLISTLTAGEGVPESEGKKQTGKKRTSTRVAKSSKTATNGG